MKSSVSYAVMSSICALIVGLLLILWPDVAVNYLVITIGVLFLLPGIYGLFSYFAQAFQGQCRGGRGFYSCPAALGMS